MPSLLRPKVWIPLLLLLGVGGLFLLLRKEVAPPIAELRPEGSSSQPLDSSLKGSVNPSLEKSVERIQKFYESESLRIGAVDPDPLKTENRLREVGSSLSTEEGQWLFQRVLDGREDSDARFFATYLLALAPPAVSSKALKDIGLSPVPSDKNSRKVDLERQIRAQAVEGLSRQRGYDPAREALMDIAGLQTDDFLRDRAHRGLYSWRTGRAIEDQDREALDKLLNQDTKPESKKTPGP
jgi:hypothetical protein